MSSKKLDQATLNVILTGALICMTSVASWSAANIVRSLQERLTLAVEESRIADKALLEAIQEFREETEHRLTTLEAKQTSLGEKDDKKPPAKDAEI